MIPS
jgi:hypothetical protein